MTGERFDPSPMGLDATNVLPESSLRRGRQRRHTRTAFVFCGGGAHGALQVGALRALMERGIYPDIVVGTSVGAWNATAIARTPTLDGVHCLTALWQSAHSARILLGRGRPLGAR
ncbi:MAG TPA: patatin-like phospholipase family protein, partial [Ktedonobacterales bacterium]